MYADDITDSMRAAIDETERRREIQIAYNTEHGIDPKPLRKKIADVTDMLAREEVDTAELLEGGYRRERTASDIRADEMASFAGQEGSTRTREELAQMAESDLEELIRQLSDRMMEAAQDLQFELAARLRDELSELKKELRAMKAAN